METLKVKKNHSYLNKENVSILKPGDVVEYYFDTQLNGRKHEKVIFKGIEKDSKSGIYDSQEREVEVLKVDYLLPECFAGDKTWITRDIKDDWYHYCIYTNGWNALRIVSVNGKKWEDMCMEKGFDNFLSVQEQEEIARNKNSELILANSIKTEGIYSIPEENFKKIQKDLIKYPKNHNYKGIVGVNERNRALVKFGKNYSVPFMGVSINTPKVEVPTLDFYINDESYRVVVGELEKFKNRLDQITNEN